MSGVYIEFVQAAHSHDGNDVLCTVIMFKLPPHHSHDYLLAKLPVTRLKQEQRSQ